MFLPHGRGDMTGSQFGRRRVSRCFWEAARLASLLGGDASRVAFQAFGRRRVSRRFSSFWEAARLASLFKQSAVARGTFSQILNTKSTKSTKSTKKTQKRFKKFLKRESERETISKMFPSHGRGLFTGSQTFPEG